MKKTLALLLVILCLAGLPSCLLKVNGGYFSEATLAEYRLTPDFPNPGKDVKSLSGSGKDLFLSLTDEEYREYAENVYNYLQNSGFSYVGTAKQEGLIAEMRPRFVYEEIGDRYDFSAAKHCFIYSPSGGILISNGQRSINCFCVTVERTNEKKYNPLSRETYNTVIRLGDRSVYLDPDGTRPIEPTGTFRLTVIDEHDFIYDKPRESESYFAPFTVIRFHCKPITDVDLAMYVDGNFYSLQNCIEENGEYVWEFIYTMEIKPTTVEFRIASDELHRTLYYQQLLEGSKMKGVELYCFRDGDGYSCVGAVGTNRNKSVEEITEAIRTLSCPLDEMKKLLAAAPDEVRQSVFIIPISNPPTEAELSHAWLPEQEAELAALYEALGYTGEETP